MVAVSLANYDGSSGTLVDTNVWIDCIDERSVWHDWSVKQVQICSQRAPLHVNLVIFTELLVPGADASLVDALLDVYDVQRTTLPWACAALTAAAFAAYHRQGGSRLRPMPDLYIGAHAAVANFAVLTRDPAPYRRYFPRLVLIAP